MKLLEGKTAIITGGSRGIGKGICELFAQNGCNIAFTYMSSDEKAQALASELEKNGIKAKGYKSDAANFASAEKLAEDVLKDFETIDVLVNNAGITRDNLLMRMTEEHWDEVVNTNMKSVFNMVKACQRTFLKKPFRFNHQHELCSRSEGKCWSSELRSFQSWSFGIHQIGGA